MGCCTHPYSFIKQPRGVVLQAEKMTKVVAIEGSFCEPRNAAKVYNLKKYVPVKADWSRRKLNDTVWNTNGTDVLVLPDGTVDGPYREPLEHLLEVLPRV